MADFQAYLASESDESDLDEEGLDNAQLAFEIETPPSIDEPRRTKVKSKGDTDDKINPKKREKYKELLNALNNAEENDEGQDMEV